jgi:hypothetical protein
MNHFEETYTFRFKLAYTTKTKNYAVSPSLSIRNFIREIRQQAPADFDLNCNEDIEIVEMGQFNNIYGHDAEFAPALEESDRTLGELYENRYKFTSFYIRKFHTS